MQFSLCWRVEVSLRTVSQPSAGGQSWGGRAQSGDVRIDENTGIVHAGFLN